MTPKNPQILHYLVLIFISSDLGEKYPEVYKIPKDKGPSFTVVHYAGVVKYDLIGVLEKNRDTLPNAVLCTMKSKLPLYYLN